MIHVSTPIVMRSGITDNELAWIEFLRLLSGGADPAPSLPAIQALRCTFAKGGLTAMAERSP